MITRGTSSSDAPAVAWRVSAHTDISSSPTPSPTTEATDSDGDGLTDDQEKSLRTNLYSNDSDLDGVFDGYEVTNGYEDRCRSPIRTTPTATMTG